MPYVESVGNFVVVARFCRSEINTVSNAIVNAENCATNMPQRRKHYRFVVPPRPNATAQGCMGEYTDIFVSLASFTYVKEATPTITQRTPLLRRKALICAILMAIMGILN